jgi:hypothetical protein
MDEAVRRGDRNKVRRPYQSGTLPSKPAWLDSAHDRGHSARLDPNIRRATGFPYGIDPHFEIVSAAGVFENNQHVIKTIADPEFSKAFLAVGSNKGLIGVALFLSGPEGFATRTPFRTLADLRGKKIRVQATPLEMEQIARLGATGVPLSLGDVLPALQQGTIRGGFLHRQYGRREQTMVRHATGRPSGNGANDRPGNRDGSDPVDYRFPGAAA